MTKYPIGIQTFSKIREDGYLYVDKTEFVARLVQSPGYYFLSRPRRFGKSLLISTLESYYRGRRDLFKGLAIENYNLEWDEHPVFHLDLNSKDYIDAESLNDIIGAYLEPYEQKYRVEAKGDISERFFRVIKAAAEHTGQQAVVLIDEYDKPLLASIDNDELQTRYSGMLKGFYGVLKSADRYLKFVMLTGVTRFGKVSVFSDLNNLRDISLEAGFDAICGITEDELHNTLGREISNFASNCGLSVSESYSALKYNYDGYHFSEALTDIYNPFSVLNALAKGKISNYWFDTGTPSFLIKLLQKGNYDLSTLDGEIEYDSSQLVGVMVSAEDAVPMLYQSGYLTIKKVDEFFNTVFLGYPNHEVEDSFLKVLLPAYSGTPKEFSTKFINDLIRYVSKGEIYKFLLSIQSLLAKIPVRTNDSEMLELHYHNMMYLISQIIGLKVLTEYQTSNGRIDMVIETAEYVYVMEFKLGGTAEKALAQIEEKDYSLPFKADRRKTILVGASFSNDTKTLSDWIIKPLN